MTRKRCDPKANWEEQQAGMAEKAWQSLAQQGVDPAYEKAYKESYLENQMVLKGSSPHPRMRPPPLRERIAERIAILEYQLKQSIQKMSMIRPLSMSTLSWTPVKPDIPEAERNANRQAAPVGWEPTGEQDRGAVMAVLGGRSSRRR